MKTKQILFPISSEPLVQRGITIVRVEGVVPINTLEEGIALGGWRGEHGIHCSSFKEKLPDLDQIVLLPKDLFVVCFGKGRRLDEEEYVQRLFQFGLRPCLNAANYFLGLMALVGESHLPKELKWKDIVAAEPRERSKFTYDGTEKKCFLYACRTGTGRVLNMATVAGPWSANWAFLAERCVN